MKLITRPVARLACVLAIAACTNIAALAQGVGIGTFSATTAAGTETVTLTYKTAAGIDKTLTATVALAKGVSAAEKAAAIAKAINKKAEQEEASVSAEATEHIVTVGHTSTGSIEGFTVTNGTKEKVNKTRVSKPAASAQALATVSFANVATGRDADGAASIAMVGTDRGLVSVCPGDYGSTAALLVGLRDALLAKSIAASIGANGSLVIAMDDLDGFLHYGCTDAGLLQTAAYKLQ